jgi:hypothetical protein
MQLVDPFGHGAGRGITSKRLAGSRYGRIVELPKRSDKSKAVAVEVCNAKTGGYVITASEHTTTDYLLKVRGDAGEFGDESVSDVIYVRHPTGGRTCSYRFAFSWGNRKVAIRWLNSENQFLPFGEKPDCESR